MTDLEYKSIMTKNKERSEKNINYIQALKPLKHSETGLKAINIHSLYMKIFSCTVFHICLIEK